jgi:hypothetical protein
MSDGFGCEYEVSEDVNAFLFVPDHFFSALEVLDPILFYLRTLQL